MLSENIIYVPAVRTSTYNLGAIKELFDPIKDVIIPRLLARGKDTKDLYNFLQIWSERPVLVEVSNYELDADCPLNQELKDPKDYFGNKFSFFENLNQSFPNVIPVIDGYESTSRRDIVQFSLKISKKFEKFAIRLDLNNHFTKSFDLLTNLLNSFEDSAIQKLILIIDAGKIETLHQVSSSNLKTTIDLVQNYSIPLTILSSTSYPTDRPAPGTQTIHSCLDLTWQTLALKRLQAIGIKGIYGDFSATDPYVENLEFEFPVKPIPFATYLLNNSLEWVTIRKGRGGENDKFRDIANDIISNADYHGHNFCYANGEIHKIATNQRDRAGNQAFWNKLKINQHISAVVHAYQNGVISSNFDEEADEDDSAA